MEPKVIKCKILSKKEDVTTSYRYFIDFDYGTKKGSLRLFDITKELSEANDADRKDGHKYDTGPRFGWDVYRACEAARAFLVVEAAWERALDDSKDFDAEHIKPWIGFTGGWRHMKQHKVEVVREWKA